MNNSVDNHQSSIKVVIVEPFYGGSHKQLVDLLVKSLADSCTLCTLPAKKWHWRARTSALYFSQTIPEATSYRVLFCSSVLNLAELVALRPDLGKLRKVLYFHENQLVYPVRKEQGRDFQYGYNQILSAMVADNVIFNSKFNMDSFLEHISTFLKLIPDHRPKDIAGKIKPKSTVLYFPIAFDTIRSDLEKNQSTSLLKRSSDKDIMNVSENKAKKVCINGVDSERKFEESSEALHIVWPHRWEHDKNPELFFKVLRQLKAEGLNFKVSVLGETFTDVPDVFEENKAVLADNIVQWGYMPSKEDYYEALKSSDVVVSTAVHEFFGVAMLEAIHCGCYPLCPKQLVYPEILQNEDYLYNTENQLFKKLKQFCRNPHLTRKKSMQIDLNRFSWTSLRPQYLDLLETDSHITEVLKDEK